MFKMHPGARPEPVLAAWGIDTGGKPVFVALAAGGSESTDAWGDFLEELAGRGLRPPLLVISDGAAGLISAIESSLPRSLRQKCLIHRARNVLAKVPAQAQEEIRGAYWQVFDTAALTAAGVAPGQRLVAAVQARIDAFARTYATLYPAAVRCLLSDCEQLTSYLRFPAEHHKRIRHSNFIERTFGETRRRVKVIGRLPGEASCLNLVWAVLDRASRGWRSVAMTQTGSASSRTCAAPCSTRPPAPGPAPPAARPPCPTPPPESGRRQRITGECRSRRLTSTTKEPSRRHLHRLWDATGCR